MSEPRPGRPARASANPRRVAGRSPAAAVSRFLTLLSGVTLIASLVARPGWSAPAGEAAAGAAAEVTPAPVAAEPLEPFAPFLDKTWRALVDAEKGVYDVARWELALGGQAIRIVHSVGDGGYGGETLVMWDREREELIYYYFTTGGFYTHGTMSFDAEGRLVSEETVAGHEGGVTEVRAVQTVRPDGALVVTTRLLRHGVWEDGDTIVYTEAPEARVVLPDPRYSGAD